MLTYRRIMNSWRYSTDSKCFSRIKLKLQRIVRLVVLSHNKV